MKTKLTIALFTVLLASAAHAQQRTFVASTGNDANPCSRTQPCRNFAAAVAAVVDGGEVVVLDSAGYGPVSIGKSVSLIAPPGVYAGIAAPSTTGVLINSATATVVLRGLTINGNSSTTGIWASNVAVLHVDDCLVTNVSEGILMQSGGEIHVDDSVFRDGVNAIYLDPTGVLTGSVDHCRWENNTANGFYLLGSTPGSTITINDSVGVKNANSGVYVSIADVNVKNSAFANNGVAIEASSAAGTSVSVSDCIVVDNQIAFANLGGGTVFKSFGDNDLVGNPTSSSGTITTAPKQ